MEGEICCDVLIFWTKFTEVHDNSLKVRVVIQNCQCHGDLSLNLFIICCRKNGLNYFYSLSINFLNPQTMITYTNIGKSMQHNIQTELIRERSLTTFNICF